MEHSRREIDVVVAQREDLTGSQRRLPDSENCALKDQSVTIGATCAGATLESLVLLVGDDLKAGPVDTAYSLNRSQTRKDIARDQITVDSVIEELADRLMDVASTMQPT